MEGSWKKTIINCFKKSPLFNNQDDKEVTFALLEEDLSELNFLVTKKKLEQQVNIEDIIDIKEENIIVSDIEDSVIIEMIKNDHMEMNDSWEENQMHYINDQNRKLTKLELTSSLNDINLAYDILKNDRDIPKKVLESIYVIKNYIYKQRSESSQNEDITKWFNKK